MWRWTAPWSCWRKRSVRHLLMSSNQVWRHLCSICFKQQWPLLLLMASIALSGWNGAGGSRGGQTRWDNGLLYLPEWNGHPREEFCLMWALEHWENAGLEQHISPHGIFFLFSYSLANIAGCSCSDMWAMVASVYLYHCAILGLYCTLYCNSYLVAPTGTCRSLCC